MPRIRSVHPDICTDETLAELDDADAERLFVRLWTHLDDDGRCVDNARLLKAALFPLHDAVTAERVTDLVEILVVAGLLERYVVDGVVYLTAKPQRWARWQKPRRHVPSKLPAPPGCADVVRTRSDNGTQRPPVVGGVGGEGEGDVDGGEGESEGEGERSRPLSTGVPSDHPTPPLLERCIEVGERMGLLTIGKQP